MVISKETNLKDIVISEKKEEMENKSSFEWLLKKLLKRNFLSKKAQVDSMVALDLSEIPEMVSIPRV